MMVVFCCRHSRNCCRWPAARPAVAISQQKLTTVMATTRTSFICTTASRPKQALEAPMKSDREIEQDIGQELEFDPVLDASDIAVSVKKGVLTLAGFVHSYAEKYEAEAAAKRVA